MKEIVAKYKELWQENSKKKSLSETLTKGEKWYMAIGMTVLFFSVVGLKICERSESIDMILISMMGVLASSFLTMYKLNAINSKVFKREDLRQDDWFDKLREMLGAYGIQSDEAIEHLREWCTDVVNEKTEVKVFAETLEKIVGIIIIPTIITVVSVYLSNKEDVILYYESILAIVAMLWFGLVIYIVPHLLTRKNDDREIIKSLNRDLIELQIYMKKRKNICP